MKILKPGDRCPCCGKPIKTTDPDDLYFLSVMKEWLERRGIKGGGSNAEG